MPLSTRFRPALRAVALVIAAAAGLAGGWSAGAAPADAGRTVRIVARSFEFVPAEIILRKGEPVTLEIVPAEVLMGFEARTLKLRADLPPGAAVRLAFTPDTVGSFPFRCSIFCGEGHRNMKGTIVVVDASAP